MRVRVCCRSGSRHRPRGERSVDDAARGLVHERLRRLRLGEQRGELLVAASDLGLTARCSSISVASRNDAQALTVLLSKLRTAIGSDVLVGRGALRLALEPDARVDVEQALAAVHRAESAVVQQDWAPAWSAALCAQYVADRPLLPGQDDLPWLDGWRRRLDDMFERALEAYAAACLGLGGTELAGAERAARRLVEHNPLRETGYSLLMQALAARGHAPEALRVYERARTVLRDELGIPPGPALARLHTRLLEGRQILG
jgi:SARP family transcriptional regulator, regulator of embCAB operon